jgi:hypothetical protein
MRTRLACVVIAILAGTACTDTDSTTDLNPEGPPMIRQVRLTERYLDTFMLEQTRKVFAFGTHPLAFPDEVAQSRDVRRVERAIAVGNGLRIIMDELLVGNNLEEIACRGTVDDDAHPEFGRVPLGADPDDVARCAVSNDALLSTCKGSNRKSVCICRRATGCSRGGEIVPEGDPVGVLDINLDGSADDMRFIPGAVGIQCGSISVPLSFGQVPSVARSHWNPSGDQNRPAMGGFEVLGPAIVLVPIAPLPTSAECGLVFSPEVVDKQGERVCAPAGGDIAAGCLPGDVSAFSFRVEPLHVLAPQVLTRLDDPAVFPIRAPVDPATLAGIQIDPAPPGAVTLGASPAAITITVAGGWAPMTEYAVTFPATLTDTYGQPLPGPLTYRFTTGS